MPGGRMHAWMVVSLTSATYPSDRIASMKKTSRSCHTACSRAITVPSAVSLGERAGFGGLSARGAPMHVPPERACMLSHLCLASASRTLLLNATSSGATASCRHPAGSKRKERSGHAHARASALLLTPSTAHLGRCPRLGDAESAVAGWEQSRALEPHEPERAHSCNGHACAVDSCMHAGRHASSASCPHSPSPLPLPPQSPCLPRPLSSQNRSPDHRGLGGIAAAIARSWILNLAEPELRAESPAES
jgi:hypothetical protein